MNKNQARVLQFIKRIPYQAKDLPTGVQMPPLEVRLLRARLTLEETLEFIREGLGIDIWVRVKQPNGQVVQGTVTMEKCVLEMSPRGPNMELIADGIADMEVVNNGAAVSCGLDMQPIYDVVMDNNELKIDRGSIDEHGKLVKPKDHPKPDIKKCLKDQGWTD